MTDNLGRKGQVVTERLTGQITFYSVHPDIIDTNTAPIATPRVLLLQEDQASGGVNTISTTLCQTLRQQAWPVNALALNQRGWRQRWSAASQCDVLLASHNFRPAYVAWALGLLLRKPVVVWVHGPLQEVLAQAHASPLKRAWLRWLYRRVPTFVFVSRTSQDSFLRFMQKPLTAPHRSVVIPNAVAQTDDFKAPQAGLAQPGNPQLAYIGRLSAEKQPALLLEMLRLLPPQFRLTLVGDGPLRDELNQSGADLIAQQRLALVGSMRHDAGLYAPWHLTVLASRYEGCPMTLLESLAAGVPCVGVPIAALQEVVGVEAPYLLARDGSARALADAVQTVWTLPRQQVNADMARVLLQHQLTEFVERWQAVLRQAARRC